MPFPTRMTSFPGANCSLHPGHLTPARRGIQVENPYNVLCLPDVNTPEPKLQDCLHQPKVPKDANDETFDLKTQLRVSQKEIGNDGHIDQCPQPPAAALAWLLHR